MLAVLSVVFLGNTLYEEGLLNQLEAEVLSAALSIVGLTIIYFLLVWVREEILRATSTHKAEVITFIAGAAFYLYAGHGIAMEGSTWQDQTLLLAVIGMAGIFLMQLTPIAWQESLLKAILPNRVTKRGGLSD